jgi:hypothetical protein
VTIFHISGPAVRARPVGYSNAAQVEDAFPFGVESEDQAEKSGGQPQKEIEASSGMVSLPRWVQHLKAVPNPKETAMFASAIKEFNRYSCLLTIISIGLLSFEKPISRPILGTYIHL